MSLPPAERRQLQLQARREGKAVYYRNRAASYRADASRARGQGAGIAARRLDGKANADEATAARLLG